MAQFLVVDDNEINGKILIKLLQRLGAQADWADGGRAGLKAVQSKSYDLIFVEAVMAPMDGGEILQRMKAAEENLCGKSPIIAVAAKDRLGENETADAEEEELSRAEQEYLAQGFDGFLNRPVKRDKLEELVRRLLPKMELAVPENTAAVPDLPVVADVDWELGQSHFPRKEMLLEAVLDFYKALDLEADTLEDFYHRIEESPEYLEQYRIKVHAMKATANLIGAAKLGEQARELEYGARDEDFGLVKEGTPGFLAEWRSYRERLAGCVAAISGEDAAQEEKKQDISDYSIVIAYLEMLRVAMAQMDIDGMDDAMEKLEGFRYPENMERQMRKLSVCVTDMDVEQASTLIEELIGQIAE